jgi:ATP-dependent protease ClpP protease subunit/uncharacterized coiled-coil protein SlyX
MPRIEVRGVIVPADYDVDFLFPYIQKGLITPESYLRKQIAKHEGDEMEVYVNSQGGSVFAGSEMINAIQDWVSQDNRKLTITVGALAASMGSAIVVTLANMASKIKVHSNTKFMFHGAFGGNEGGSQSMRDTADLLDKINSDIKVKLINNYNLPVEQVDSWFAEGREGWLTASEAVQIGMADEIIGEASEAPEEPKGLDGALTDSGMKIAARALSEFNKEDTIMEKLKKIIAELEAKMFGKEEAEVETEEVTQEAEEVEDVCDEPENEQSDEVSSEDGELEADGDAEADGDEEEAGEVEGEEPEALADAVDVIDHLEQVDEIECNCMEKEETINKLNDALNKKQSENDKLKAELDKSMEDVDKLTAKMEKLLGGINFTVSEDAPTDWKSCLAKCDGDYVAARKAYPSVYAEYRKKSK